MADAMVTARMPQEKKDAGNRVLAKLGLNASQMINQAYDYLIENRETPFALAEEKRAHGPREIADAIAFVSGLRLPSASSASTMTDDEIRQARLIGRGLVPEGSFS